MSFPEPFQDVLRRLHEARGLVSAWAAEVPRGVPGAPVPEQAPAPPPDLGPALAAAAAAFHRGGHGARAALCAAAAAAARRMGELPALVSAEAAASMQRAIASLVETADDAPVDGQELFPAYRAMQHLAGAERIHPADLWGWHCDWRALPSEPFVLPRQSDTQTRAEIESALLALMRQPGPEACAQMSELCAALGEGQQGRLATLWKLAAAVYDAQRARLLAADVYLKRLGPRLLALARGSGITAEVQELLLRDLLFHCAQAVSAETRSRSARLEAVVEAFELPRGTAARAGSDMPARPAARVPAAADEERSVTPWHGSPLAAAVPGLPAAGDLDLSDLDDWTEPRTTMQAAPAGATSPPAGTAASAPIARNADGPRAPATPDAEADAAPAGPAARPAPGRSGAARALATPPRTGLPPNAAVPAAAREADPISAHFAALESGCAAAEEALAALRRHLGATEDTHEPGSDPAVTDGVRLALDAAVAGLSTVTHTAQALRLATDALRKVRFDALTGRLHEFVGQVARESGRPVRWALYGGAEAVDRSVLERIASPVEQLLRLSVEHGIESAAQRQQAGKQAAGYVELRVARQVDGLSIDISDDGAALDAARLRSEALRLGLEAPDVPPTAQQFGALLAALAAAADASAGQPALDADATPRRLVGWARVHPAVTALGARLELPADSTGRTTVRLALRE